MQLLLLLFLVARRSSFSICFFQRFIVGNRQINLYISSNKASCLHKNKQQPVFLHSHIASNEAFLVVMPLFVHLFYITSFPHFVAQRCHILLTINPQNGLYLYLGCADLQKIYTFAHSNRRPIGSASLNVLSNRHFDTDKKSFYIREIAAGASATHLEAISGYIIGVLKVQRFKMRFVTQHPLFCYFIDKIPFLIAFCA